MDVAVWRFPYSKQPSILSSPIHTTMAPAIVSVVTPDSPVVTKAVPKTFSDLKTTEYPKSIGAKNTLKAPLKISPDSELLKYKHFDSTVAIGTEFPRGSVEVAELLRAPNSDDLIRDLGVLIAERGVVFFRGQHITADDQRELAQRLGELTEKPETSKLHIHPYTPEDSARGDEVYQITSGEREKFKGSVKLINQLPPRKNFEVEWRASSEWVRVSVLLLVPITNRVSTLISRTSPSQATTRL